MAADQPELDRGPRRRQRSGGRSPQPFERGEAVGADARHGAPDLSVAIIVGGSAALTNGRVRLPYSVPLIAATVVAFAGSLVVIIDLDQKFGGFARIEPVDAARRRAAARRSDTGRRRRLSTSGASHFPDDGESVPTASPHPSAASLRCANGDRRSGGYAVDFQPVESSHPTHTRKSADPTSAAGTTLATWTTWFGDRATGTSQRSTAPSQSHSSSNTGKEPQRTRSSAPALLEGEPGGILSHPGASTRHTTDRNAG